MNPVDVLTYFNEINNKYEVNKNKDTNFTPNFYTYIPCINTRMKLTYLLITLQIGVNQTGDNNQIDVCLYLYNDFIDNVNSVINTKYDLNHDYVYLKESIDYIKKVLKNLITYS